MPARSVCLVTVSLSEAGPGRFGGQAQTQAQAQAQAQAHDTHRQDAQGAGWRQHAQSHRKVAEAAEADRRGYWHWHWRTGTYTGIGSPHRHRHMHRRGSQAQTPSRLAGCKGVVPTLLGVIFFLRPIYLKFRGTAFPLQLQH